MNENRKKGLIKNTMYLSLGTFVPKLFAFIITPLLTGNLTKPELGQYDLINTLVSLLLPAATLQMSSAAFRYLIDERGNLSNIKRIVTSIYTFVSLTTICTAGLFYAFYGKTMGINGILVCLYFVADMYLKTTGQIMRGLGKYSLYSKSAIISSFVNLILLITLIGGYFLPNYGLTGVIISLISSVSCSTLYLLIKGNIFQYISISGFSKDYTKRMLAYSWPMVPNNLSGWVLRLSDRLVILAFLGIEANAVYSVANRMPALISTMQNVLISAWQENASIAAKDNDKEEYYSQMCDWIFRLLFGIAAVVISASPILWKLLIRGDYEEAYYQLPVLYIGMLVACMSSVIGGIYIAYKKTVNVGISTTIAAVINLSIDLLTIKAIGIWAGSISTLISYLVLMIYRMINVQKFQKIAFKKNTLILGFLGIITMSALVIIKKPYTNLINYLVCLFVVVALDHKIVSDLMKMVILKVKRKEK